MQQSGILWKRNELLPSVHCPSTWTHSSQNANIIKRIFTYKSSQSCSPSHIQYALHNICPSLRKWYQLWFIYTVKGLFHHHWFQFKLWERPLLGQKSAEVRVSLQHYTAAHWVIPFPVSSCHVPWDGLLDLYTYSTELYELCFH